MKDKGRDQDQIKKEEVEIIVIIVKEKIDKEEIHKGILIILVETIEEKYHIIIKIDLIRVEADLMIIKKATVKEKVKKGKKILK